jgi:hypothetical protein
MIAIAPTRARSRASVSSRQADDTFTSASSAAPAISWVATIWFWRVGRRGLVSERRRQQRRGRDRDNTEHQTGTHRGTRG